MAPHHRSLHRGSLHDAQLGLQRLAVELRSRASALPEIIKVDISQVPDWKRRATRLSIAVVLFGILGHCINFGTEHAALASSLRQSCNWAAITCIVVTAPVIGKVAQVAFDRLLGTAVGGFIGFASFTIGFHLFGSDGGPFFVSLMSGVTVWGTTYLAFRHSLDQLARFMQLTYVIVAFGAKPDKGASLLALIRVSGIFAGGLLSVFLAVVVLPRSASVESLREMRKAMKALHDLNREVWALSGVTGSSPLSRRSLRKHHRHGYSALKQLEEQRAASSAALPHSASDSEVSRGSGGVRAGSGDGGGGGGGGAGDGLRRNALSADQLDLLVQHDEELDSREAAIEKLFTAVYTTLDKVDEALSQTKGEVYIWHFWGRYFFLPGVHWFPARGRWQVPKKDMQDLATCLRRVARMLWTLLLDFEEGFGAEMQAVLHTYYPAQLLSELADYQARAILDLLQAFPSGKTIEVDNLFTLGQVTDCLLQISDARARTAVFNMKRRRPTGPGARSATPVMHRRSRDHVAPHEGSPAVAMELQQIHGPHGVTKPSFSADPASAAAGAASLERAPLLAPHALSSAPSGASGGLPPASNSGVFARLSTARNNSGGSAAATGGSSGGGVFISRLLSGQAGGQVALPLPPRRFLQGQGQQSQVPDFQRMSAARPAVLQSSPGVAVPSGTNSQKGAEAALAPQPAPAPAEVPVRGQSLATSASGSVDVDILGGLQFEPPEGSPAASPSQAPASAPASGPESPSVHRPSHLSSAFVPPHLQTPGFQAHASRPRPHPALPTIMSSQDVANGVRGASASTSACGDSPPNALTTPFDGFVGGGALVERQFSFGAGAERPAAERPVGQSLTPVVESGARSADATFAGPDLGGGGWPGAADASVRSANAASVMGQAAAAGADGDSSVRSAIGAATATAASGGYAGLGYAGWEDVSVRSAAGGGGGLIGGELSLGGSSLMVEPITFPPTEEGYLTQVRWYSFQFVMDELVNELEEAFCAASAVLRQLPYPVGA